MARQLWKGIWKFLNTDIQLFSTETVASGAETGKAVLDLAKALDEHKALPELVPLVGNISSLLDVLNLPLVQVAGATLPFVSLATGTLKLYLEHAQQEPSLEECVMLVSQAAYLESFQVFLNSPDNQTRREQLLEAPASKAFTKELNKLGEKLEINGQEFEFDTREAEKTLICFHESKLAEVFNPILSDRLQEAGLDGAEAHIATERISCSTHRYMKRAFAGLRDSVKQLAALYGSEWTQELKTYDSIDRYLEAVISQKPLQQVFDESFTFKDVYVPLKVRPIKPDGRTDNHTESLNIESWAESLLQDPKKQGQVLFIEGGPGRGKSVFCRMFADLVRRKLYPIWIPILIRLRDVRTFELNFEKTLQAAVGWDFATSDNGWLTNPNTRFLFLLDGFDELLLERGISDELKAFLHQVGSFQSRCKENSSERGHRILITGRPFALHGIERLMPPNLERVEIIPMDRELQGRWFAKWAQLAGTDTALTFQQFLKAPSCPSQVQQLAQEPLLLYLLAAMHRDNRLNLEMFEGASSAGAKIQIYEEALNWVLTKQRTDQGHNLNLELTKLDIEDLRSVLAEAGLCVVQTRRELAPISMIEERLKQKGDEGATALLKAARDQPEGGLKNALATFYLNSVPGAENSVEFLHKSFGEFLCAERLLESLEAWTDKGPRGKGYNITQEIMNGQIYDLLGYGNLTEEIVEYLMALLDRRQIDFIILFERLHDFYLLWCSGDFIDDSKYTLPQDKSSKLQKYGINLGQRQVDIFTGLNILILLLKLNSFAQLREDLKGKIIFYPCGQAGTEDFDQPRLLHIISYSNCLNPSAFSQTVGPFLADAQLSNVTLMSVILGGANLSRANLSGAYLANADLSGADLSSANLTNAYLRGASLDEAYLADANLSHADLSRVDLSNASLDNAKCVGVDLSNAKLTALEAIDANFRNANLSGADLTDATFVGSDLSEADCAGSTLVGICLHGANLSNANFRDSNLCYASFDALSPRDIDLSNADFRSANFRGAIFDNVSFREILWDKYTKWAHARGLHRVTDVPDALGQQREFSSAATLSRGLSSATMGQIEKAIALYEEAQQLDPQLEIAAEFWHTLCWFGSLSNHPEKVIFAGEAAVTLVPEDGEYRDSLGLARARSGDIQGAIESLQAAVDLGLSSESLQVQRQHWIRTLRAGGNPFTPEELELLHDQYDGLQFRE
ncbi:MULTISPECIES: pentapeptide repeat-containing protein [Trichocoleus]|uniref:Pentapeptide repeat-containing protein n=1 Tax=Trichocoleus desertorum GB2-A4 TaxID=2933944 RepID=A0ABV0JCR7_9CYAN|nr:pentapeptide repeat-containing protein [Trichocoleus sp. FACHB-46]MBD1864230.1 pentapeptide repeat-containing protein [Trichocoleus sp. FACHB-46]